MLGPFGNCDITTMGMLIFDRLSIYRFLPGRWKRRNDTRDDLKPHTMSITSRGKAWGDRAQVSISTASKEKPHLPQSPYHRPVEAIREDEYPHMKNGVYLDHGGTTIYARSTVSRFADKMRSSLYGNPHSANEPAKTSGDMVNAIRLQALQFLGADPQHFDLVFVANSTAAIKLVADSFRDLAEKTRTKSFWYGYHRDAHTSLVGVRELTHGDHQCFATDSEVEAWLERPNEQHTKTQSSSTLRLFAYPGQSNLTGRRLPLSWPGRIRKTKKGLHNTYTLLDAAALAMTSPLHHVFDDPATAPDFCCVSFYKIFGFPDLGGLVVRKDSGHILALRKYFGGGTVSLVSTVGEETWHMSKGLVENTAPPPQQMGGIQPGHAMGGLHEGLEDGTLPFHSILALGEAIDVHGELYGSMENISAHVSGLVGRLYRGLSGLRYYRNGQVLCRVYFEDGEEEEEKDREERGARIYGDSGKQGPTVAFNVFSEEGTYISYAEVERMANERGVFVRSGGVCCPGGVYAALQYEQWQMDRAKSAGHHCGPNGLGIINELPTGVVRASLGAMSTTQDVDSFISFLREAFIDSATTSTTSTTDVKSEMSSSTAA
ncbi:pyridoxal phosphate-dependent transferase [Rhypophila decipiens]|uniref:Pyridoxal phosphate-dependent transferase n=1 Tax=Rhypophila decipiens TaxID=261697 RepID=A0AAN6YGM6_9PEZI|nr:pyridoxal phosphate-dependent transferase [Rhypophila decipiens]